MLLFPLFIPWFAVRSVFAHAKQMSATEPTAPPTSPLHLKYIVELTPFSTRHPQVGERRHSSSYKMQWKIVLEKTGSEKPNKHQPGALYVGET